MTQQIDVTQQEKDWLEFARFRKEYDAENRVQQIKKTWNVGRLEIEFNWQSSRALMGRFGGGWNWNLGFRGSGRHWIFYLLICSIAFREANRTFATPRPRQ